MKLLFAVPAALLLACACGAAPAQEKGVVESMLPNADISASLTTLAAQPPALAPAAKRKVIPLSLIGSYWKTARSRCRRHSARRRTARCRRPRRRSPCHR